MAVAACAPAPPSSPVLPLGIMVLDADTPLITAEINGRPLRLRVDPGQWDMIELAPAVANSLGLSFEPGPTVEVGRERLPGRTAATTLRIAGRSVPVQVSDHGRPPAPDADGLIGPDLLPYASVVWRRSGAPAPSGQRPLPLRLDPTMGWIANDTLPEPIRLRFSLLRTESEATAAAAARLAQTARAHFTGPVHEQPAAYGLTRPVRPMTLDPAPIAAGFRLGTILVRIADFRGRGTLPADPVAAGEIRVLAAAEGQHPAYWVTLGRDRLDRCAELTWEAATRSLTLSCAFDVP